MFVIAARSRLVSVRASAICRSSDVRSTSRRQADTAPMAPAAATRTPARTPTMMNARTRRMVFSPFRIAAVLPASPRRPGSRRLICCAGRGNPPAGGGYPAATVIVRLLASIAALSVGVAGVVIVAVLLHRTPGPVSTATTSVAAAPAQPSSSTSVPTGFPAPPPSAVVFTRQDGGTVLALAVTPVDAGLQLQASAVGPAGHGTSGLRVSFTVAGRRADAVTCGAGCYRAALPAPAHPRTVGVTVRGDGLDTVWSQQLPTVWPAPDATALVERAGRVWRSLESLAYVEHLASDPQHAITSVWRIGSPDRVAYQVLGGYAGIVIGDRRWDKAPGGRWVESVQSAPLTQPVPTWTTVDERASPRQRQHPRPARPDRVVLRPDDPRVVQGGDPEEHRAHPGRSDDGDRALHA